MGPGLAKIINKECISRYFKSPETDLHIAGNAWCIEYADTMSSNRVHKQSNNQSTNRSTIHYGWVNTVEWDTGGVTRVLRSPYSIKYLLRLSTATYPNPRLITRLNLLSSPTSKSWLICLVDPRWHFWNIFVEWQPCSDVPVKIQPDTFDNCWVWQHLGDVV